MPAQDVERCWLLGYHILWVANISFFLFGCRAIMLLSSLPSTAPLMYSSGRSDGSSKYGSPASWLSCYNVYEDASASHIFIFVLSGNRGCARRRAPFCLPCLVFQTLCFPTLLVAMCLPEAGRQVDKTATFPVSMNGFREVCRRHTRDRRLPHLGTTWFVKTTHLSGRSALCQRLFSSRMDQTSFRNRTTLVAFPSMTISRHTKQNLKDKKLVSAARVR